MCACVHVCVHACVCVLYALNLKQKTCTFKEWASLCVWTVQVRCSKYPLLSTNYYYIIVYNVTVQSWVDWPSEPSLTPQKARNCHACHALHSHPWFLGKPDPAALTAKGKATTESGTPLASDGGEGWCCVWQLTHPWQWQVSSLAISPSIPSLLVL